MAALRIAVLGSTEVHLDGAPVALRSVRQRRLLAALVLWRRGASVSRLADALWADGLPRDPPGALANQVARLRALLGAEVIASIGGGYRLGDSVACDVDDLDRLAATDAVVVDAGVLWRGAPYEDLDVDEARVEAVRLTERILALRETFAEQLLRGGAPGEAASLAAALAEEHPLRERARLVLAEALAAAGRRADALRELDDLRRRLVGELGVDPSSAVDALYRRLLGDERSVVRRRPVRAAGPLIGRDDVIATVLASLGRHRLVTLTGPGGVGKTALALAVGERAGAETIDLVSLGAIQRDDEVAAAVAAQLAIDTGRGEPLAQRISDVLAFETGLLVLDNAEHVIEGVRSLVERLLTRTPIRILLTSRVRLGHPHELVVDVPPLAAGGDDGGPACRLFVERARSARPTWQPDDLAGAIAVCERLDGLPLAIELAAAQLASRTLGEILGDLDQPLDLLRGSPAGSAGLRRVFDRSFRLLDALDRAILGQIAVFHGGFTIDTAVAACAAITGNHEVVHALDRLVHASLLTRHNRRHGTRYALLETIRAYVLERAEPCSSEVHDQHAAAVLRLVERGSVDAYGDGEPAWAERLVDERANIVAAFGHFAETGDVQRALRVAIAAYVMGIPRRHVDLADLPAAAVGLAEQGDGIDPTLLVECLGLAADAAAYRGDSASAHELLSRAMRVPAPGPAHRYGHAVAADLALYAGDIDRAVEHLQHARNGFQERGQHTLAAWMQATIPLARSYGNHSDDQVGAGLAALEAAQRTGCPSAIAFARYVCAEVLRLRDRDEAARQAQHALDEALVVDAFFVAGLARLSLATDATARGHSSRSASLHREAIKEWERLGNWAQQAITLRAAALLTSQAGRHQTALTILLALDALTDHRPWGADADATAAAMETARCALPDDDLSSAARTAARLTRVELVAYTLSALADVQVDEAC